jgi:O-antigen ligase
VKWLALACALALVLPAAAWLRRHPAHMPKMWLLFGFVPFANDTYHWYMALISWSKWPGYVKGIEVSSVDLVALTLYLCLPRTGHRLPFRFTMGLYFLAVLLSTLQAPVPEAALFYPWQLARVFLVYAAVVKGCADERMIPSVLTGMAIGLSLQAGYAIWDRVGLGILQAAGGEFHQNFLGLMSHFVVFPCAALLLAGVPMWRPAIGLFAGLLVEVLTVSRATVGLAAGGYAGLFFLSALRGWTRRKALFLAFGVVAIAALAPFIQSSFERRFAQQTTESEAYEERLAFARAAIMMIEDHPMGVGANSYVTVANAGDYNIRAGVSLAETSRSQNVHNVYLLVAAETGYVGLITYLLVLLRPLVVAFRCGWRQRGDRTGDLLLGLGMALLVVYFHSNFEWIFITWSPQYLFAMDAGLIAGLAVQLGYWPERAAIRLRIAGAAAPITKTARR